jgi:hypothetical protein
VLNFTHARVALYPKLAKLFKIRRFSQTQNAILIIKVSLDSFVFRHLIFKVEGESLIITMLALINSYTSYICNLVYIYLELGLETGWFVGDCLSPLD